MNVEAFSVSGCACHTCWFRPPRLLMPYTPAPASAGALVVRLYTRGSTGSDSRAAAHRGRDARALQPEGVLAQGQRALGGKVALPQPVQVGRLGVVGSVDESQVFAGPDLHARLRECAGTASTWTPGR